MKDVPFPGPATPTAGSPAWASHWALMATHTAKLWGMGPREQEGTFHLQFWNKELDLEHVFAGGGCKWEGPEISSPICSLRMTCCKSSDRWQLI